MTCGILGIFKYLYMESISILPKGAEVIILTALLFKVDNACKTDGVAFPHDVTPYLIYEYIKA